MGSTDADSNRFDTSSQRKIIEFTKSDDLDLENCSNSSTNHDGDQIQKVSSASDCESGISGSEIHQEFNLPNNGLIKIHHKEKLYEIINKKLVSSASYAGLNVEVEAIYKNTYSGILSQAKLQCFCVHLRALKDKCGGNPNVKYAWFGASKNEIKSILLHGFGHSTGAYGHGIYLSPADHPAESAQMSIPDEYGLRHLLLCRVIMGRMEAIRPGSQQYNPSSEEFDSGVDNLVSPRNYIVWSTRMNTHILPEFVISFRTPSSFKGNRRISRPLRQPKSPWIPFMDLTNALSKFLPPHAIKLIAKHHHNYIEKKITRRELIKQVRFIAGDKLLGAIIKSYRGKAKATAQATDGDRVEEIVLAGSLGI